MSIFEEKGTFKANELHKTKKKKDKNNSQHLGKKFQQILKYFSYFPRK